MESVSSGSKQPCSAASVAGLAPGASKISHELRAVPYGIPQTTRKSINGENGGANWGGPARAASRNFSGLANFS